MQQAGFWRTQLEVLLVTLALSLLVHAVTWISPAPWAEIISIGSLGVYIGAAWRLAPGTGSSIRRILRVLAWAIVCAVVGGVAAWLLSNNFSYGRIFLGTEPGAFRLPLEQALLSSLLITPFLFGFGRTLRNIREATRTRLRWQLTYGFLVVSIVTALVVYVAIGVYLSIYSVAAESPMIDPQSAAERLSTTLEPIVLQADPAALQASLQTIIAGTAKIPTTLNTSGRPELRSLAGLRRLVVILPAGDGGRVVAAAGAEAPAVGILAGIDLVRFRIPLAQAFQQNRCVVAQPIAGSIPDSAICPIGTSGMFLVVETLAALESAQFGAMIGRTVAIAAASLAIALGGLVLSSVVVLLVSGILGYLLARRTTKRIEQVAAATTAFAAGERQLITDQRSDEIGQLAAAFNRMADQLAEREAALKVARDHAEELLAANRRMVANISHELRTPLATLRGYLEALQHSHGNQLPGRDMEVIHTETERLTSLIDDLFTLTRAEARQLPLQLTPVDLYALVSRLAETIAPLARRQRSLELVTSLPAHLPLVLADTTRLEQILLNLIQNALRHTPPGGIIAIDAIAMPTTLAISVSDTGEGIAAEDLPFVFERFYRGDSSRSRETGGAGLGLALVRELTEAMGGSVSVESTPGRGSKFTVRLCQTGGQRS